MRIAGRFTRTFLGVVVLFSLAAPSGLSAQLRPAVASPKSVARAYLDAWNCHDPAGVCATVSEGAVANAWCKKALVSADDGRSVAPS